MDISELNYLVSCLKALFFCVFFFHISSLLRKVSWAPLTQPIWNRGTCIIDHYFISHPELRQILPQKIYSSSANHVLSYLYPDFQSLLITAVFPTIYILRASNSGSLTIFFNGRKIRLGTCLANLFLIHFFPFTTNKAFYYYFINIYII